MSPAGGRRSIARGPGSRRETQGRRPGSSRSIPLPLLAAPLLLIGGPVAPAAAPPAVAIADVHLVPMDSDRVEEGMTVLVRDGRITAIGPQRVLPLPEDVEVIRGDGVMARGVWLSRAELDRRLEAIAARRRD
jgi:hypothetical protein